MPPLPFVGGGWCHGPLAWPVWAESAARHLAVRRTRDGQPTGSPAQGPGDGRLRCAVRPWALDAAADSATLNLQAGVFCSLMVTVAMQMVKVYIVATLPAPPSFPM